MADLTAQLPRLARRAAPAPDAARAGQLGRTAPRRLPRIPLPVAFAFGWVALLILLAVFGPALTPHNPLRQNLMTRNVPPVWLAGGSWDHVFGTDQIGYDILSRVMVSVRPTLTIGVLAALIALATGTLLGMIAGYFRGPADGVIMLLADSQLATPYLVIAIAAVAAFGQSIVLLILLAGLSGWMGFARTVRSRVLSLRAQEFVESSRALGAGEARILGRHILPNITSTVIVLITIQFRALILFEAALSFLGLGVPPPQPSWGSMIDGGRDYLLSAWWISVIPGLALTLTVLTVSLIGDWLRDVLDPRLRSLR
ncbi:MAG: ABC transporter permease [Thermomicrobiales bacterium]